jgi:hypothetical protein
MHGPGARGLEGTPGFVSGAQNGPAAFPLPRSSVLLAADSPDSDSETPTCHPALLALTP